MSNLVSPSSFSPVAWIEMIRNEQSKWQNYMRANSDQYVEISAIKIIVDQFEKCVEAKKPFETIFFVHGACGAAFVNLWFLLDGNVLEHEIQESLSQKFAMILHWKPPQPAPQLES